MVNKFDSIQRDSGGEYTRVGSRTSLGWWKYVLPGIMALFALFVATGMWLVWSTAERANMLEELSIAKRDAKNSDGIAAAAMEKSEQYRREYSALLMDYAELKQENELLSEQLESGLENAEDKFNQLAWEYAGEFMVYHYCDCEKCTGHPEGSPLRGLTRSGTYAEEGRTVAVDPDVIPLGSEIMLNGKVYIAEDTGARGNCVDVYVNSHEKAQEMGTYRADVYWRGAA